MITKYAMILLLSMTAAGWSCSDPARPAVDAGPDATPDADAGPDADVVNPLSGRTWEEVLPAGERWEARGGFGAVVFDGKLWVMGGMVSRGGTPAVVNDVWVTADGVAWERVKPDDASGWCARANFAAFVAGGRMWVTGGNWDDAGEPAYESDAWWSVDGVTWTRVLESHWPATDTAWGDRKGHAGVGSGGRLFVLGGADTAALADVWVSDDGAVWERLTLSGEAWEGRAHAAVLSREDTLWLLGGQRGYTTEAFDDVLSSPDGARWTRAGTLPAPVYGHAAAVFDGDLWVLGGQGSGDDGSGTPTGSHVWRSPDGDVWTAVSPDAPFPPRWYHQAVVFQETLWVLGGVYQEGMGIALRDDLWRLTPDPEAR